jgi:MFS family permease
MYSVAVIIGSPLVGRALTRVGRKVILVGGLCSMGLSMIGFGMADLAPNSTVFGILVFFFRFCQGASSCSIQTTSYAVISMSFPQEQEKYIAVMQTAIGTGLIMGPVIGTFLYTLFGFSKTFFLIGFCFLGLTFALSFLVPSSIDKKDDAPMTITERRISQYEENVRPVSCEPVSICKLIFTLKFILAGAGGLMAMFMFCYMEPVLAFRLQEFGISPVLVGTFFSIQPVSYVMLSMTITYFTAKYANRGLLMFGGLMSALTMLLVGPSHYLPNDLNIMAVGQLCVGAFGLFLMVPAIPEMISAASEVYPRRVIEITDVSAGVFNCLLGTGQVIAPIFGSSLTKMSDFRRCSEVLGVLLFIYSVIYFLFGGGFGLLKSGCKEKKNKETDVVREDVGRAMSIRNRLFSAQTHDENFDLDTIKLARSESLLEKDQEA